MTVEKSKDKNQLIKKRIMYEKQEDFYYILYHIIILLQEMNCKVQANKCVDFTKLAYLYPFIANQKLSMILSKVNDGNFTKLDEYEVELLSRSFYESRLKMHVVINLLTILKNKNIISFEKNNVRHSIDVWIKDEEDFAFLRVGDFDIERERYKIIRSLIPRVRTMRTDSIIDILFKRNGVIIWEV